MIRAFFLHKKDVLSKVISNITKMAEDGEICEYRNRSNR
jgi:hypothetical protein